MVPSPRESLQIRELQAHDEFAQVVDLQRAIWGFEDADLLPVRLFVVATKIGGQLLGAFDGSQMVGFCLCIPGLLPDARPFLHSHMLGVLKPYRNTGLGRALKLAQRDFALAKQINVIEWTFDPLEIKNAFFNIERLGAIVRKHVPNQYGTTSSRLHGHLPTDRLIAEWWLASDRVRTAVAEGGSVFQQTLAETTISVPANIDHLKQHEVNEARSIQSRVARDFEQAFAAGLVVIGFEKTDSEGKYLLGHWR